MSESFAALHSYVTVVAFPNSSPAPSRPIPTQAHGGARMITSALDEPASNENADPEDHSPATARQLRHMEISAPDEGPAGRMRRASRAFARLFQRAPCL